MDTRPHLGLVAADGARMIELLQDMRHLGRLCDQAHVGAQQGQRTLGGQVCNSPVE